MINNNNKISSPAHTSNNNLIITVISSNVRLLFCRPGFLPDPNDGSLYILGGKHKEGLMVKTAESVFVFVSAFILWPHCFDASAETAVHHPRAGPVSSLQELWWCTLYRWSSVCMCACKRKRNKGHTCTNRVPDRQFNRPINCKYSSYISAVLKYLFVCVCVHMKVRSRMCGSWWILRRARSKPV